MMMRRRDAGARRLALQPPTMDKMAHRELNQARFRAQRLRAVQTAAPPVCGEEFRTVSDSGLSDAAKLQCMKRVELVHA